MLLTLLTWALLAAIALLAFQSRKHSGYAFALVTSTYAVEHIILQGRSGLPIRGAHTNIFMGLSCLFALGFLVSRGSFRTFRWENSNLLAFVLIGFAILSTIWAPDFDTSWAVISESLPYLCLFVLLAPFCLFPRGQIDRFMQAIVLLGGLVCLGLMYSELSGRSVQVEINREIMNLNPLAAGSYGAYTAICGMFLIYKSSLAGWWKFLMYGVVALGIFVIAQSGSRGQLLGFVITSAVWLPVTAGAVARKSVVIALVVTVVAAVAAYFLFGELGWTSRIEGDQVQHSIDFRVNLATELVSTCWSKGIFYVLFGLGNSASYSLIGSYPHLVPLEILAEEGFIGFGLFLSFIIVVFRQLQVAILDSRISRDDRTALCLLACLFTFELLLCLKQGSLMGSTALFSFGLGLTYALKTVGMQFPITATQIKSRTPNTVPRARNSATGRPLEL